MDREHVLSRDCWCQPEVDHAPVGETNRCYVLFIGGPWSACCENRPCAKWPAPTAPVAQVDVPEMPAAGDALDRAHGPSPSDAVPPSAVDRRACHCGKEVRLRVSRITWHRRRGLTHWIEHADGTKVCIPGEWSCAEFKPYQQRAEDRDYAKLLRRWDEASPAPVAQPSEREEAR